MSLSPDNSFPAAGRSAPSWADVVAILLVIGGLNWLLFAFGWKNSSR